MTPGSKMEVILRNWSPIAPSLVVPVDAFEIKGLLGSEVILALPGLI